MRRAPRRGVDGFRLDSIPTLLEDRALRNETENPIYQAGVDSPHDALFHIGRTQDVRPLHEIVRELRRTADTGGAVLICETYVPLSELRRRVVRVESTPPRSAASSVAVPNLP